MCKANYTCMFLSKLPEAVRTTASHFGEKQRSTRILHHFPEQVVKILREEKITPDIPSTTKIKLIFNMTIKKKAAKLLFFASIIKV